nr:unnamed protein product [Callosobruchus chinensis]
MKPFIKHGLSDEEKIFNYRLSRARRVSENAFGILAWRFRVFSRPIELKPDTIVELFGLLAVCITGCERLPQATICHNNPWTEKILTQER